MNPDNQRIRDLIRGVKQQEVHSVTCPEVTKIRRIMSIPASNENQSCQQNEIHETTTPRQNLMHCGQNQHTQALDPMEALRQINEARASRGLLTPNGSGPSRGTGGGPRATAAFNLPM